VQRPFELIDQTRNARQGQPLAKTHSPRPHGELLPWLILLARDQPQAQVEIDQFFKAFAFAPGLTLQLGLHVVVQRQCRSHILMFSRVHHDGAAHGNRLAFWMYFIYCLRPAIRPARSPFRSPPPEPQFPMYDQRNFGLPHLIVRDIFPSHTAPP
jgi:hypothetical protein